MFLLCQYFILNKAVLTAVGSICLLKVVAAVLYKTSLKSTSESYNIKAALPVVLLAWVNMTESYFFRFFYNEHPLC